MFPFSRAAWLLAGIAVATAAGAAQQASRYTKWNQYGGSSDSMQYSALAQINKSNVTQLSAHGSIPSPANLTASCSTR